MVDEPKRYDPAETVEVLATAIALVQGYGMDLWGMSPERWLEDAVDFRAHVKALGDFFYRDRDEA